MFEKIFMIRKYQISATRFSFKGGWSFLSNFVDNSHYLTLVNLSKIRPKSPIKIKYSVICNGLSETFDWFCTKVALTLARMLIRTIS